MRIDTVSGFFLVMVLVVGLYANDRMDQRFVLAKRISAPPHMDGSLSEKIWDDLPTIKDFFQYSPYNGQLATQQTEVKIGYDDRAIYIGAICYDRTPEKIKREISIRDQFPPGMNADMFAVLISPYNDGLNSVFLYVTAAGVQRDLMFYGDEYEINWDAVWESKVKITSFGWVVEIRIPLSVLRFSSQSVQNWGLNLWRWIARNREWDVWNFVDITYAGWWKKNGLWKGIKNLNPPVRLSFSPYVSGYLKFDSELGTEFLYNGGIDFKYGISQGFTLDATLIPDFGQVQSDDIELNLSPYEIRYNEKRQFFTEGTELFTKGDLFYSRRIGDKPVDHDAVYDVIGENEVVYKNPNESRLINATKFSGRTNFGLGIGVINAMTANTYATIINLVTGEKHKVLTQSFTNYNLVVLDQTLFSHSYISLVNSNVSRRDHTANVTAVDFNIADKTNTYVLSGIFGYSWIRSDQHTTSGYKLLLNGGKIGGNLQLKYNLSLISDEYNQNDFGYLRRNNEVVNWLILSHQFSKPFACFLSLQNQLKVIYGRVYEPSDFSELTYNYEMSAQFKNYFQLQLSFEHAPIERRDYHETRVDDRYFINHKYIKFGYYGMTDPRRPVWIELGGNYTKAYDYEFDTELLTVAIFPHFNLGTHFNLGFESVYEGGNNQLGYVEQNSETGSIFFGKRDRNTVINTIELSYLFTHKISLTFRLRHYHSKAGYDSFFELMPEGTFQLSEYSDNHDINYNAFNIDFTLRWNFAPGSEILLNWKNSIYTSDQFLVDNYWQNFVNTLDQPQTNSISLKVIYYFDL